MLFRNKDGGLYTIGTTSSSKVGGSTSCNASAVKDWQLFHARLGHLSLSKLVHLNKCKGSSSFVCDTCEMAKFHRLPFPINTSRAAKAFDLIHIDLWGAYKNPDVTGAHYILTILDDHTRSLWTFLLQNKMQIPTILSNFISHVENQFGTSSKCIRSDNETKFIQSQCTTLFAKKEITQHKSIPKTPQQNGRIERKHRHLIDTARALKLHANMPDKFWGDCVLATTHVINKLPSALLDWKTPFECLFNKSPDYIMLKVIGCLCYALDLQYGRNKFSPKARRCIFLGYPSNQKAYKLYDLDAHVTFVRRDVKFHEYIFPYQPLNTSQSSQPLFPPHLVIL